MVFSFYSPLFDPEVFHTGNYIEIIPQTKKPLMVIKGFMRVGDEGVEPPTSSL